MMKSRGWLAKQQKKETKTNTNALWKFVLKIFIFHFLNKLANESKMKYKTIVKNILIDTQDETFAARPRSQRLKNEIKI